MSSEDLYDLRNALSVGNYTQVISEAPSVKPSPYNTNPSDAKALESGRDFLVAKAQIGLGRFTAAISELESSKETPARALVMLAQYLKADSSSAGNAVRERIVETAKEFVETTLSEEQEATASSALMATTAATILVHAGDLKTAYTWLRTWALSLQKQSEAAATNNNQKLQTELDVLRIEVHSHIVDLMLRLNRTDKAEQELKQMTRIDEDAVLTLLWTGFVKITPDGAREANQLFTDLAERFGTTTLLQNGIAAAHMAAGEFEAGQRALDEISAGNDADTLINQMGVASQLRRKRDNKAVLDMLRTQHPSHPWVYKYKSLEDNFTDAANVVKSSM